MKRTIFLVLCFALLFLLLAFANKRDFLGEEDTGWCIATVAVACAVVTAAVDNKWIATVAVIIGFLNAVLLGLVSAGIYVFGMIAIIWMVLSYPEVKSMITQLWAPEKEDKDDDEEEK